MSCDSTVFEVNRLQAERLQIMVQFLAVAQNFSFSTAFGLALGSTQPPIQWVPGACFLKAEQLGHAVDHSHLHSAEANNAWTWNSFPHMPSWHTKKEVDFIVTITLGTIWTISNS